MLLAPKKKEVKNSFKKLRVGFRKYAQGGGCLFKRVLRVC